MRSDLSPQNEPFPIIKLENTMKIVSLKKSVPTSSSYNNFAQSSYSHVTKVMLTLGIISAIIFNLNPAHAGTAQTGTANSSSLNLSDPNMPQLFAGEILTQSRAEAIAEAAGFELISYFRCAIDSDDCAMIEVAGSKNVFVYQINSETCSTLNPVQSGNVISGSQTTVSLLSAKTSNGQKTGKVSTSNPKPLDPSSVIVTSPQTDQPAEPGNATSCFGGFMADYRIRKDNLIYINWGNTINTLIMDAGRIS